MQIVYCILSRFQNTYYQGPLLVPQQRSEKAWGPIPKSAKQIYQNWSSHKWGKLFTVNKQISILQNTYYQGPLLVPHTTKHILNVNQKPLCRDTTLKCFWMITSLSAIFLEASWTVSVLHGFMLWSLCMQATAASFKSPYLISKPGLTLAIDLATSTMSTRLGLGAHSAHTPWYSPKLVKTSHPFFERSIQRSTRWSMSTTSLALFRTPPRLLFDSPLFMEAGCLGLHANACVFKHTYKWMAGPKKHQFG